MHERVKKSTKLYFYLKFSRITRPIELKFSSDKIERSIFGIIFTVLNFVKSFCNGSSYPKSSAIELNRSRFKDVCGRIRRKFIKAFGFNRILNFSKNLRRSITHVSFHYCNLKFLEKHTNIQK